MATRPLSRIRRNICLLLVALLLMSWGYFIVSVTQDYQSIERQSRLNLNAVAMGLEAHTRQMVQVVDILQLEITRHHANYYAEEMQEIFGDWLRRSPELAGLVVIDVDSGELVFSLNNLTFSGPFESASFTPPVGSSSDLQIADKLYSGSDGRRLIALLREFREGARRLLVVSLLYADYLLDFHQDVTLGENGSVAIFHHQGLLLARKPQGRELAGLSYADGPLFRELLPESPVGVSRAPEDTDGVSRIVAHRKLADLPLVLTVGSSVDWVFAEWQSRLQNLLIIQLAVTVTILLSLAMLFRTLTRVEKAEIGLEEREEHFRSVANSTVDAVISVDDAERIRFWSVGAEQTFSCTSAEALGMPASCFLQFADENTPLTLKQLARINSPWAKQRTLDVQGQRKNGEIFPTELSVSRGTASGRDLYTLIVRDVTERKQMEERIRRMASHDNLTGLPNRGLLMDRLQVAMAQVRRQGGTFALLFVDLDQFKPVNDNYGHEAGDKLLQQVAKRMLATVRASDTVARVGGDEFAVLLINVEDEDSVTRACEHLLTALRRAFKLDGHQVEIGCSIGVVLFNGQEQTASGLIGLADNAMYAAKRAGRNRFIVVEG